MENFVRIADRLPVAAALAALDAMPPIYWVQAMADGGRLLPLLGPDGRRRHEEALAEAWVLIDTVRATARDGGRIDYARAGRMPPGDRVLPHVDGHDGVARRRYQIILAAAPGAEITLGGEIRHLAAGEAWQLDTSKIHWVENRSDAERVVLVFDTDSGG